ncbi:MAG: TRAP-type C4-dicarboxylate transport system permease small subunit [Gammaproteobacteria bacterium]|jgi:TRAP-type C4-dicarboxylate transport system permease small subunit
MQKFRHYFYRTSLILSGSCLVLMTLLILGQIVARFMGEVIPSSEDFAGWLLSATVFFGLAYTFNIGGHIRVTMLLGRLSEQKRHWQEIFNIIVGLFISGYIAFYTLYTVYDSYDFEEVTDTYLVMPLWLVQTPMAVGSLFLFIAVVDNCIDLVTGKTPGYIANEEELSSPGVE